jgi:MFS family permease
MTNSLQSFFKHKDRVFYGWVTVITLCTIGTILMGTRFSYGVFFKSIAGEFELTRAVTSGIFSISMIFGSIFAVLGGWALDRYGPRILILVMGLFTGLSLLLTSQTNSTWQLFITYSLLLSIGTSAVFVVIISTVSRWFDKKRGLAIGIANSGNGLGPLIMAPFATYLISSFDWRIAYIVIGLIALVIVIPLSKLLKKDPHEIGALPDGANSLSTDINNENINTELTSFSLLQTLKTKSFWLFLSIWFFAGFNLLLILTHIVPHATDIGHSAGEAATILSLMSGASILGRIIMGRVSDNIGRKTTIIICSLLRAGAPIWLIWAQDLWMLYLFAMVYGFAQGGLVPPVSALVGDIFGLRNIGKILGMQDIGYGIGAAIGPAIGGFIFDIRGSYSLAFLFGAVAMLLGTVSIALIKKR